MRKSLIALVLFAVVIASSTGFVGCTSLLGDFEVSANGGGEGGAGEGGAGEGGVCTVCGSNACANLATDNANCGACGTACASGKTCQASECKCAADSAFCAGACVKATRMACGPACGACQPDEVCNQGCAPAPLPAFETTPRDPTGWTDSAGAPITIKLKQTGVPGTIYECRTGPDAQFTPTEPVWKPCDGATGANPTHAPVMLPATPEGTYRTEHRYRSDNYRSPTVDTRFYAHRSLDKVATCPRQGDAADGPKFTDAEYFQAAQVFAAGSGGAFPIGDAFPVPSYNSIDPFVIRNPFIKIPFTQVRVPGGFNSWPQPAPGQALSAPFDHVVNERSLRHKFVVNGPRTMLLVKRQYVHPTKKGCANTFEFGSRMGASRGPLGRGVRKFDCEALVLTVHGQALCMGRNKDGTAPQPQAIDQRVYSPFNANFGNDGTGTVSGAFGSTALVASPGAGPLGALPGRWIFVGPEFGGRWYKVAGNPVGLTITLAEPLKSAPAGQPWKYSDVIGSPTPVIIIPAGFTHLYDDGKNWATAARATPNFNPSFSTKCETPGCNTGKPWLTFLPR